MRLAIALFGASLIAFMEKTIEINNIDLSSAPLTATSQLLPFTCRFILGCLTTLGICEEIRKEGKAAREVYEDYYSTRLLSSQVGFHKAISER